MKLTPPEGKGRGSPPPPPPLSPLESESAVFTRLAARLSFSDSLLPLYIRARRSVPPPARTDEPLLRFATPVEPNYGLLLSKDKEMKLYAARGYLLFLSGMN